MLLVIGLVGLAAMAIPAFGHSHGAHAGIGHGAPSALGRVAAHGMAHAHGNSAGATRGALQHLLPADATRGSGVLRFLPSPRAVFSVLALYGAFGNAGVHAFHLAFTTAALAAALPAFLVELLLVRPLWNTVFRLESPACSPLTQLILNEALAVTPFRNGRGMVSTMRDGRRVQLVAVLRTDQVAEPVKVGARLVIEDVDSMNERVTVAILRD